MNKSVDDYFLNGCGRCPMGGTPDCKVHQWTPELKLLRKIVGGCGLTEESKWGVPCYTYEGKNVLMICALKEYCCISFFKGSLLSDNKTLLAKPGPNSQAVRLFKFRDVEEIVKIQQDIKTYILESIELEKVGKKVPFKKNPEPIPEELAEKLESDPNFKTAFESLTPGRQRGYILHIAQAKQPKTRIARIERCAPMILNGIGLHDNYKSKKK